MSKIIQDPINGPVKVSGLFEELIDSPEFQRLRYVKQLGLTNLVFPGANHTRFEHSLGTYYIAELMADFFNVREKDLLLSSALLHDIGHPAMSHSLENFFRDRYGKDHQDVGGQIISGAGNYRSSSIPNILEKYSVDPQLVSEIVRVGSKEFPLISTLISGSIDADELDYLRRDAFSTGVAIGLIDHMRILNTIRVENQDIYVEEKGIPSVESLLISRVLMYNSVYFHKTCRIAQNMMVSAMSVSEDMPGDPFMMNDWELIAFLKTQRNSRKVMADILDRRLLKPVIQVNYTKEMTETIRESLREFNDSEVFIDIIPPLSFSGKGRSKSEVKAMRGGKVGQLELFSPLVRSLNETLESRSIVVSARKDVFHRVNDLLHSLV
ncbi:MAG: HD domain-containing protein [Thermoplasmataceae archaeon]